MGQETRPAAAAQQDLVAPVRAALAAQAQRALEQKARLALAGQQRPAVQLFLPDPLRLWGRVSLWIQRRGTHGGSCTRIHTFS